jgi:Family of unknown function (DUF6092)
MASTCAAAWTPASARSRPAAIGEPATATPGAAPRSPPGPAYPGPMSDPARQIAVTEEQAYELLAHLVCSADVSAFEPHGYGTFRLLDAASRLMGYMLANGTNGSRPWLEAFKPEVDRKKLWLLSDRDAYGAFLGQAGGEVGAVLRRRALGRP